jgi:hypothetical protein
MRLSRWFWVRIAVIAGGGLQGVSFVSREIKDSSNVSWTDCLLMSLFAVFGTLVIIGIQAINPRSAPIWRKPSWKINPFLVREPLQFFHCAAYFSLVTGIVACATSFCREMDVFPFAAALIGIGAGMWLGVRLSLFVFRRKMGKGESEEGVAS